MTRPLPGPYDLDPFQEIVGIKWAAQPGVCAGVMGGPGIFPPIYDPEFCGGFSISPEFPDSTWGEFWSIVFDGFVSWADVVNEQFVFEISGATFSLSNFGYGSIPECTTTGPEGQVLETYLAGPQIPVSDPPGPPGGIVSEQMAVYQSDNGLGQTTIRALTNYKQHPGAYRWDRGTWTSGERFNCQPCPVYTVGGSRGEYAFNVWAWRQDICEPVLVFNPDDQSDSENHKMLLPGSDPLPVTPAEVMTALKFEGETTGLTWIPSDWVSTTAACVRVGTTLDYHFFLGLRSTTGPPPGFTWPRYDWTFEFRVRQTDQAIVEMYAYANIGWYPDAVFPFQTDPFGENINIHIC
jgi:hypothetical protein